MINEKETKIIKKAYEVIVNLFKENNLTKIGETDRIIDNLLAAFFGNSILNINESQRATYIDHRTNEIAEMIATVTAAIMNTGETFEKILKGVCGCENCKKRMAQEAIRETIH